MNKLTKEQRYSESLTSRTLDLQNNFIAFYHPHPSIGIEHRTDLVFSLIGQSRIDNLDFNARPHLHLPSVVLAARRFLDIHIEGANEYVVADEIDRWYRHGFDGRNCFGNPRRVSDLAVDRCVVRILEKLYLKVGRMKQFKISKYLFRWYM